MLLSPLLFNIVLEVLTTTIRKKKKLKVPILKRKKQARHQWLTPIILATQEAEIRRIVVLQTLS
jgi:energy-converting hydrogenase Eha subunit A